MNKSNADRVTAGVYEGRGTGAVHGEGRGTDGGYVMVPFVGRECGCRSWGVRRLQGEAGCGGF